MSPRWKLLTFNIALSVIGLVAMVKGARSPGPTLTYLGIAMTAIGGVMIGLVLKARPAKP